MDLLQEVETSLHLMPDLSSFRYLQEEDVFRCGC